ncbi:MAG: hemolysin III family protein [Siculibacillus sp.]
MTLPPTHPRLAKRPYTQGELVADGVVHVAAIVAGMIAFPVLLARMVAIGASGEVAAVGVYATAFFLMFGFSLAYNMTPPSSLKWLLRRFDHSAIYVMIAGTYTALLARVSDQVWAWALIAAAWVGALGGSALKLAFPGRWDKLSMALYIMLGWAVVVAIGPLAATLPTATVVLIVIGGALYSVGIVFYKWHGLKFQNAIWHGFVAIASACHWVGIAVVMGR